MQSTMSSWRFRKLQCSEHMTDHVHVSSPFSSPDESEIIYIHLCNVSFRGWMPTFCVMVPDSAADSNVMLSTGITVDA